MKKISAAFAKKISRLPVLYLKERKVKKERYVKGIKKILIAASTPSSSLLEISINNAFKEWGYYSELFPINKAEIFIERGSYSLWRYNEYYSQVDFGHWFLNRRLFKKIKNEQFDLLFVLESNWSILPETIIDIRNKTNTAVVLWETNIHIWNKHQSDCLPLYDVMFCLDSYLLPIMKTAGVKRAFFVPAAVDEKINFVPKVDKKDLNRYECDIGFAGQLYEDRIRLFENLVDFDFKIFGPCKKEISENLRKKLVGDLIAIEEKRKFYNIAKIIIDVQGSDLHINSPNIRLFEVLLCGGFPLVEYRKDLKEMFVLDKELVCYYDINDLRNKIKFYLDNPLKKNEIMRSGRDKIIKNHLINHRVKQMMDIILKADNDKKLQD